MARDRLQFVHSTLPQTVFRWDSIEVAGVHCYFKAYYDLHEKMILKDDEIKLSTLK